MNCFSRGTPLTDDLPIEPAADHLIDDAPCHLAAKGFLPDLAREATYTLMGFYLGWAIGRGMTSQTNKSG